MQWMYVCVGVCELIKTYFSLINKRKAYCFLPLLEWVSLGDLSCWSSSTGYWFCQRISHWHMYAPMIHTADLETWEKASVLAPCFCLPWCSGFMPRPTCGSSWLPSVGCCQDPPHRWFPTCPDLQVNPATADQKDETKTDRCAPRVLKA